MCGKRRQGVPVASDGKRKVPNARWTIAGAPKGNRNAFKHGHYPTEAIVRRREISVLIRVARALESSSLSRTVHRAF
jgi:uncharacterized protein YjcR